MKNRKEKERKTSWGEKKMEAPSWDSVRWYIYAFWSLLLPLVLVAQWLVHLLHKQNVGGWFKPQLWQDFVFPKHFSILLFQPLI